MMPQQIEHDFYYGAEAEQYVFYRFPKALITNDYYSNVSDGAKILYGLMLDRMGLSIKNKWLDAIGRVYIYYTLEDVQESMRCGHNKVVKIISELDHVGLIERVKQGQGRPTIIYVKRFVSDTMPYNAAADEGAYPHDMDAGCQDFRKEEIQTSDFRKSRLPYNGSADFPKADTNNNYLNNPEKNNTDPIESYRPPTIPAKQHPGLDKDGIGENIQSPITQETIAIIREEIREQIDYHTYAASPGEPLKHLNEIVELMLEVRICPNSTIRIARSDYPIALVRERFSRLTSMHIEYVRQSLEDIKTRVRNIKQYLLAALYNAPITMEHHDSVAFNYLLAPMGR
jgi:Replication initiator protein A (RepA) N-terminus.